MTRAHEKASPMPGAVDLESGAGIGDDRRADRRSGEPTRAADAEEPVDWPDKLSKVSSSVPESHVLLQHSEWNAHAFAESHEH